MRVRVQKWGDDRAVCIPESFATAMRIEEDTEVELSIVEGQLTLGFATDPEPTLEELLERITPEDRPGEFDTGPSVGAEEW